MSIPALGLSHSPTYWIYRAVPPEGKMDGA
jgi:hypothetical protein